nr:Hsp20/alpha crystallin family protein [Bacilli bacterium]
MLPSIFDDVFDNMFEKTNSDIMKTDVKVVGDNYLVDISVPGYAKEDIKLELEKGYLTVTAEKNKEVNSDSEKYIRREISYGKCSRTFYVGDAITEDEIKANYKNGILSITVPKTSKVDNKKVIEIED